MRLVGVKDLKDNLSYYLNLTKQGDRVIVTDRGTPVAILHNLDQPEKDAGPDEKLAVLARDGKIRLPVRRGVFPKIARPEIKGKPMSQTVIEERR